MKIDINKLKLVCNPKEECWELLEKGGLEFDPSEGKEDALIARFYDGNAKMPGPIASILAAAIAEIVEEESK